MTAPKQGNQNASEQQGKKETSVPAVRHVGRTLESDPRYDAVLERGGSSPEAQVAADLREAQEAGTAYETNAGQPIDPGQPEPLKTRLPGHTSSDPHTDVGPDNATTVQNRGEEGRGGR